MKKILTAIVLAGAAMLPASWADVTIYAKSTFEKENGGLIPVKQKNMIYYFPKTCIPASHPYFYVLTYPRGSKRRRLKLNFTSEHTYNGKGQALTFEATNGKETMVICSGTYEAPKNV